jgi:steroid delta-isomerase-like uncharacterized protein
VPGPVDDLIDAWERAWSGRDPEAFRPLAGADMHYEDPLTREPLQGASELAGHAQRLWAAFPDARLQRTGERLHDGHYVAAPAKLVATHKGPLAGLAPTGRFVVIHAVFYCELDDSDSPRLHRVRAFFDAYDAAVQLSVLPGRGTLGEKALMVLRGFGLRPPR